MPLNYSDLDYYGVLARKITDTLPLLLLGHTSDTLTVTFAVMRDEDHFMPSLKDPYDMVENAVFAQASVGGGIVFLHVDHWLEKNPGKVIRILAMAARHHQSYRRFRLVASSADMDFRLPGYETLELVPRASRGPRRVSHKDSWADDDSFDGLMDLPRLRGGR